MGEKNVIEHFIQNVFNPLCSSVEVVLQRFGCILTVPTKLPDSSDSLIISRVFIWFF